MKHFLILLLLLSGLVPASFAGSLPDVPHIVVTGEYEIRAVPDIVTISLSISETGFEVAKARNSVEARSRELISSFTSLSIAKEDISSSQLQITPHYNWNNSAQIYAGTEVSRTVEVTLRDLNRYDELIRSIIDAGVAQIHSTRLSSSKEQKLREDALRGAIQAGLDKAQIMVAHLPEKIGPMYSISSQNAGAPVLPTRFQMAESKAQSAFEPGTILFQESVQLVFYLVKEK